jgi:hypothetical protein
MEESFSLHVQRDGMGFPDISVFFVVRNGMGFCGINGLPRWLFWLEYFAVVPRLEEISKTCSKEKDLDQELDIRTWDILLFLRAYCGFLSSLFLSFFQSRFNSD